MEMHRERGFTLIELLTVCSIIGVLLYLGLKMYTVFRADAAYASADSTVGQGVLAIEASSSNPDEVLPSVNAFTQQTQGAIADPDASRILPGMMIPRMTKVQLDYDPACNVAACEQAAIEARHRYGHSYVRWVRYGDGLAVRLEHLPGLGY